MSLPIIRKKQVRFSAKEDINLLKEVLAENPFKDKLKWNTIADHLKENVEKHFDVTARRVRERTHLLMNQYAKEDKDALRRSGSEEECSEKEQFLQEILSLNQEEEKQNIAKAEKKENEEKKAKELRERAMESLTPVKDTKNDDQITATLSKRLSNGSSNGNIIEYLKYKSEGEKATKEEEIHLKKEELKLEREKFELEREERKQRMEFEKNQQNLLMELIKKSLNKN